jgi:Zn-dependent protease with chaperone function
MDFFARQEDARARTRGLLALFVLGVFAVVTVVTAALVVVFGGWLDHTDALADPVSWLGGHALDVASCALAVLAIILIGAAVKSLQLQGGGAVVARSMGADLVSAGTTDPRKRQLLNVVEEMALASGVPVPAVYVMEGESAINAFAAGHTPADSVIAVTRGALARFDRDELQGVIGHEFSHILNADVRRDLDLMAMVAGLFAIATVGRLLLRGGRRSRKAGAIALAGLAMLLLGYVGVLFGRLMQAAISRQREFLADASAVQFTRNPQGLRDALVLVGAVPVGSRLVTDEAHQTAHMLFAAGVQSLFATHPPLTERIRRLDPTFQPQEFERVATELVTKEALFPPGPATPPSLPTGGVALAGGSTTLAGGTASLGPGTVTVGSAALAASVANPRAPHVHHAALLRVALPPELVAEASDPTGARVLLVALVGVVSGSPGGAPAAALAQAFGPGLAAAALQHAPLETLPPEQRLPLLLQAVPALGRLPVADREALAGGIDSMVNADGTLTLSEYALARLARMHLHDQLERPARAGGDTLLLREADLVTVFSVLARAGSADPSVARGAFERGFGRALPGRRTEYHPPGAWASAMDEALDRLDGLRPADKSRLLDALALIVAQDGSLEVEEAEMLRAICGSLHCPLPPFVDLDEEAGVSAV